jgi:hypothetical protein
LDEGVKDFSPRDTTIIEEFRSTVFKRKWGNERFKFIIARVID